MRVTSYSRDVEPLRPRLNSNTIALVEGVTSFAELMPLLDRWRTEVAPARILITIDDSSQAAYTSMHAAEADDFYLQGNDDLDWDDPVAVAGYDDLVATHIARQLDTAPERDWTEVRDARASSPEDVAALARVNTDPDTALDRTLLVQRAPVERDDLAIAGLPNGYFSADWSSYDNHWIVRRMQTHGYRHIGVGASLLAFDRTVSPSVDEAAAVVSDLTRLYGSPTSVHWYELHSALTRHPLLLLGYTENFADQFAD